MSCSTNDTRSAGRGIGLHDIWGMGNVHVEAVLSLIVVVLYAAGMLAISIRVFSRAAVK